MQELDDAVFEFGVVTLPVDGATNAELLAATANMAPGNATYITQTSNGTLTNEQALASLATGILKNTTTTGVLSIATGSDLPSHNHTGVVDDKQLIIDGGGATIVAGNKGDFRITVPSTITEWNIFGDQTGSIQIDLWRSTYSGFDTISDANSITGSAPISATSVKKWAVASGGLTGWDTTLDAGDIIRVNVDSCTGYQRVTLVLWITKAI